MKRKFLELKGVSKIYKMGESEVYALRDVNLEVLEGDFLAIMGPSGSGKSTILHIMGCLDRPTTGKVLIDGQDVSDLVDEDLAGIRGKKIGFVFQFFQLVPSLTAQENVALPMWFQGVGFNESMEKAKSILDQVGLGDRLHHKPTQLSGGQQQRVAIARALANDPPVILADEPTGNLDTTAGSGIISLLHDLHESGKSVVMVTHDPEIAKVAEKHITLIDGRIYTGVCKVRPHKDVKNEGKK